MTSKKTIYKQEFATFILPYLKTLEFRIFTDVYGWKYNDYYENGFIYKTTLINHPTLTEYRIIVSKIGCDYNKRRCEDLIEHKCFVFLKKQLLDKVNNYRDNICIGDFYIENYERVVLTQNFCKYCNSFMHGYKVHLKTNKHKKSMVEYNDIIKDVLLKSGQIKEDNIFYIMSYLQQN